MLSIKEILEGIKAALAEEFPGAAFYVNYAPRGFTRPACLVECGPVKQDEIGGSFVKFDVEVKVTCFEPVDSYGNSDTGALIDRMCTVMALFSGGYIKIGGRAPMSPPCGAIISSTSRKRKPPCPIRSSGRRGHPIPSWARYTPN